MQIVTNGEKFRVKKNNGEFVLEAKSYFFTVVWVPKEFYTKEAAAQYVKNNTWIPVDEISKAP